MNWITDRIAIGNFEDAENADGHAADGIHSILCLNGGLRGLTPQECGVDALGVFELRDGRGSDQQQFEQAVNMLAQFVNEFPNVLVHCQMGRSRSVVVVAAHLMRTKGLNADEALAFIDGKRKIDLTFGMRELLDTL